MQKLFIVVVVFAAIVLLAACKHDAAPIVCSPTVTDYDGNIYNVIKIGNQCWLKQNLKTTHFQNGQPITEMEDSTSWANNYLASGQIALWC